MDSTFIGEWATKIAREVTPNEIYDAQFMANEFVRGGRDRKKLFKQIKGGEVGGSGLGEFTTFFPYLLQALVVAGPIIYRILSDGAITNGIFLIKEAKAAYEVVKKKRVKKLEKEQAVSPVEQQQPVQSSQLPLTDQPANSAIDPAQTEQLQNLINEARLSMVNAMIPSGKSIEELEEKSHKTMIILFEKPEDAARFIDMLRTKS